jgi:cephalosporin hydroxylase
MNPHGLGGYYEMLYDWAKECPVWGYCIDIGTNHGGSALSMALGAKAGGHGPCITIDYMGHLSNPPENIVYLNDPQVRKDMYEHLQSYDIQDHVVVIGAPSASLSKILNPKLPIRMLFIDGGHHHDDCLADLKIYYPRLRPGGYLVMHDFTVGSGPETALIKYFNGMPEEAQVMEHSILFMEKPKRPDPDPEIVS